MATFTRMNVTQIIRLLIDEFLNSAIFFLFLE